MKKIKNKREKRKERRRAYTWKKLKLKLYYYDWFTRRRIYTKQKLLKIDANDWLSYQFYFIFLDHIYK